MKQISDSCLLLYNCNIMSLHIIKLQYRIHGGIQSVNCCSDSWYTWWDHLQINNWGGNTVAYGHFLSIENDWNFHRGLGRPPVYRITLGKCSVKLVVTFLLVICWSWQFFPQLLNGEIQNSLQTKSKFAILIISTFPPMTQTENRFW